MARTSTTRRTDEERQRRRFARRQWARRWLTLRYLAVALLLVVLVGGGTYAVYFSDTLSVQDVEVSGTDTVQTSEIERVAAVPLGGPLATADLVAVERRVGALASVRSVEVTRKWPHSVLITVQEREPVAVVQRGDTYRTVDVEGVAFGSFKRAPTDLPRIEAPTSTTVTDPDAVGEAVTVLAALPDEVAVRVDHLVLRSADEIELVLRDDRVVQWGGAEGSAQKGEVLLALLSQPAKSYDVSVPAQPVVQ
ncbi:FtsQ-type POTRA domain-containing protein [Nocardioides sp. C4-1]|uniref:cell division protein FtsQ/DivIB n=1 Tax=Nocardioides sp. C4-1 TaxID=3151851 RepID=UPI003263C665